ncbi:FAD dependent oxidoreductase [Dyadobacter jejuensis]|uniref:FAD dependent oxidoreductase n=1 Tax=Dyadobacter jejuensis TaxID=1082580 RepID=A0A316AMD7_9BACT|nr:FAD dependent oxidoreductase [Dyadobacter jejuensis]
MFSGRNVSQTHIALSSTRIQATCALMGQATGTAATLCVKLGVLPRDIAQKHMAALQEQLLRDDVFIPLRPAQDPNDLATKASSIFGSSTTTGQASLLTDGMSRDIDDQVHHWQSDGLPAYVQLEWEKPVDLSAIEIKCDSNLQRNIMMRKDHKVNQNFGTEIPPELLKTVDFEVRIKGQWVKVGQVKNNITRLVKAHFQSQKTTAVRINMTETYGADHVKLFEVRCYS